MRGIVYTGDGVEVTDALEVRGPGPNEVQVRIQAAGVCHSDLSVINGTIPFPGAGRARPRRGRRRRGRRRRRAVGQAGRPRGDRHPGQLRRLSCLQHRTPDVVQELPRQHLHAVHLQGGARLELRGGIGVLRGDDRQRGPGGAHSRGGPAVVRLPHRVRRADGRRCGAEPGQGASGRHGRRLRRRWRRAQRDPGAAHRRGHPDRGRRHRGGQGGARAAVRRHALRRRRRRRRRRSGARAGAGRPRVRRGRPLPAWAE